MGISLKTGFEEKIYKKKEKKEATEKEL